MAAVKKPELAAPAGDWTMLHAVVNNGADAVYFGLDELNMRAQADNFHVNDLPEISAYCREHNVKTHLVLNIILFEHELKKAEEALEHAKAAGVNSIVCWDLAAVALCKKIGIPFCVSTQASISNSIAAQLYKDMGASRIVVARECSLEQIKEIKSKVDIEIEAFVHGAMCVAISGRCFMSQEIFGRSANRGDCLQSCRREYEIYDKRKDESLIIGSNYVMSAKDLCTVEFLDKLIDAGIDAFKIEGRKRSPEYAAKVTRIYRQAIDAYYDGKYDSELRSRLIGELDEVYHRGFSHGFYFNAPGADGFSGNEGNISPVKKEYIGNVINYFDKKEVAHVRLLAGELSVNDRVLIIGKTSGVIELTVSEMIVNDINGVAKAEKSSLVTFICKDKVRQGDKVYRLVQKTDFQKYYSDQEQAN